MNDESGVLIEGFDREPMVKQPWHPPYYQRALRGGRAWRRRSTCSCGSSTSPTARRSCRSSSSWPSRSSPSTASASARCRAARCGATSTASPRSTTPPGRQQLGLRPVLARRTSTSYAQELQLVFDPRLVHGRRARERRRDGRRGDHGPGHQPGAAADERAAAAARLVALPAQGGGSSTACASASSASSPSTSTPASPPAFYVEHFDQAAVSDRSKWGEMGWILETNRAMNRGMEAMGGRIVKRYRVYEARPSPGRPAAGLGLGAQWMPARRARTVTRLGASTEGAWLRSRNWDLTFLILSAALVPIPLLMYHGLGISQTAVNLIVAGLIGGPHLYSTFTYTFMEPNYRTRHQAFLLGSLVAAGDRHDPGLREPADPADALLHVGVDPRAAPDHATSTTATPPSGPCSAR